MNISLIIEALRSQQIDITAGDVADLVWLVLHMRLSSPGGASLRDAGMQADLLSRAKTSTSVSPTDAESQYSETISPTARRVSHQTSEEPSAQIYESSTDEDEMAQNAAGIPLRTPAAQSLPGALDLARAMRPLMRRVPSRTRWLLDEEATVELIARTEERIWTPIMRPAPARWLDVALVVDSGESMRVWQQLATEVQHLLERQGAFRDVRTWRLDTNSKDGKVKLYGSSSTLERKPRELIDPTGQRLILVLTDCVSPAWKGSNLPQILREWGRSNPVALAQVLPQSLWARTSLFRAKRLRVSASLPGAPNSRLRKELSSRWWSQRLPEGMPFPVLTLEHLHVKSWSRLVAAVGGASSPAFVLRDGAADASGLDEASGAEPVLTPEQALEQFQANTSPVAMELARLLSAAAPLSLPVMRLVQNVMLPGSRQVHLAEVFLGGLLRRSSRKEKMDDPERIQYDFLPGIRDLLLDRAQVPDSVQVLKTVSAYLTERFGQSLDFPAILADPDNDLSRALAKQNRPFAVVTGKVLSRMGGRYRELAERLQTDAGPERGFMPVTSRTDSATQVFDETSFSGGHSYETVSGSTEGKEETPREVPSRADTWHADLQRTFALVVSARLGARGLPYTENSRRFREWLLTRGLPPENVHYLIAPSIDDLWRAMERLMQTVDAGLLCFYWSGPVSGSSVNDCSLILREGQEWFGKFLTLRELLDSQPFEHFPQRIAFVEAYDRESQVTKVPAPAVVPFRRLWPHKARDEREFIVFARERAFTGQVGRGGRFTTALVEALAQQPDDLWPPDMLDLTRRLQTGPDPLPDLSVSYKGGWGSISVSRKEITVPLAAEGRTVETDETPSLKYPWGDSEDERQHTILWVDDYPENSEGERSMLKERGFRITLSLSTEVALERLREQTFDLIISAMGRGTNRRAGLDLLEAIRKLGDTTPFIIYASRRALRYRTEAISKGAFGLISGDAELIDLAHKAVQSGRYEALPEPPTEQIAVTPARIFIAYKRGADDKLALEMFKYLSRLGHHIFIDRLMVIGTAWAERIEEEVRKADYLIVLLSASSVNSEMIRYEIELAHRLSKENGRPLTLPVRLNYRKPFNYPLNAYLDHINWALWDGEHDTSRVLREIARVVSGEESLEEQIAAQSPVQTQTSEETSSVPRPFPAAQPTRLETPEAIMDPQSKFYIERKTDISASSAIKTEGATISIKGPRQMGKSSLLFRLIYKAVELEKRAVFLDFQLFDRAALENLDSFLRRFCSWLSEELAMPDRTEEFWRAGLGSAQNCTRYVERYVLSELQAPLCLAMDEVDIIFSTNFRSDFFGMLRAWHNQRAFRRGPWRRLDILLVTATEPYLLVENLNQSPFNVGLVIMLQDFNEAQVAELNMRHGWPLGADDVSRLVGLLHGHPYLTRRAFYLAVERDISVDELFATAADDRGPFGDHLRRYLFLLHDRKELVEGLTQVLRGKEIADSMIFFRLQGAGLLRRGENGRSVPRCQLYADYFSRHLL